MNGSIFELIKAINNGTGIIASDEFSINVLRCPSNIVLEHPEALYDEVLPVSVAVSKPGPYVADSNGFYVATTLAPRFSYGDTVYVIDEVVESVLVRFYVNGTLAYINSTDAFGLAHFSLPLNFTSVYLKVVVDNSSLLSEEFVERFLSFGKVRIYDKLSGGDGVFQFNFSISGLDESGRLYVRVENSLKTEVSFFNQSVWNLPITVIGAKFLSGLQTNASGVANIPNGSNYLRVHNVILLRADVNSDGIVDIFDIGVVSAAYGSYPGHPNWNVDADINHDNMVDIFDIGIVSSEWGKVRDYVVFDTGEKVYVDTDGAVWIPPNATSVTVYKDGETVSAYVEFFDVVLNRTSRTNNMGDIVETWAPYEVGTYMVQFKLSEKFDVFALSDDGLTGLDASVNIVDYVEVVKRPIYLGLSNSPGNASVGSPVDLVVDAVDGAVGEPLSGIPIEFFVNGVSIGTAYTNSTGTAVVSWTPQSHVVYEVIVFSGENTTYEASNTSLTLDLRHSTELASLDGDVIDVSVGFLRSFDFNLTWDSSPLAEMNVTFYLNDEFHSWASTNASGIASFVWASPHEGTYYVKARFEGTVNYMPSKVVVAVVAEVTPTLSSLRWNLRSLNSEPH